MRHANQLIGIGAILAMGAIAQGYSYMPSKAGEALEHAQAWIKAHPERAEGYFFLGAVYGMSWAKEGKDAVLDVATFGDANTPPQLTPWMSIRFQRDAQRKVTPEDEKSLRACMEAYQRAVDLDAKGARYQLALGWTLEQAALARLQPAAAGPLTADEQKSATAALALVADENPAKREAGSRTLTALMPRDAAWLGTIRSEDEEVNARVATVFKEYWQARAVDAYRAAYRLTVDADMKAAWFDGEGDGTISALAGERLLALLPAGHGDPKEMAGIQATVTALRALPVRPVAY